MTCPWFTHSPGCTNTLFVSSVAGALIVLSGACNSPEHVVAPSPLPTPPPTTAPAPPPLPPAIGPARAYSFKTSLDVPVRDFTKSSRYVLYDSGAFSLRYEALGEGAYTGSYRQEDRRIFFDFGADGRHSQGGQSEAIGTLNGESLEVRYSDQMVHSDFENAIYVRSP
jgi:hypothetical protein